jgi:hypothetical protein
MAIVGQPKAISVRALLEKSLTIPAYQRPYKWQARHVNQLFDDVVRHRNHRSYRLGTVVLHKNKTNQLNIVDGQQRLLTLTLLYSLLSKAVNASPIVVPLLESGFSSTESIENLKHNAKVIESRLRQFGDDVLAKRQLLDFLLDQCELICVTLNDLSEAFQFFDSQNARGKALAPHDLLKAYHLREMEQDTEQARLACVAAWEADITPQNADIPPLHRVMADYLFRIRRWSVGECGLGFDKDKIVIFKGINLSSTLYPWAEPLRAVDCMVTHYNAETSRRWDQQYKSFPFQLGQPIINGQRFFEYIQHYIQIWQHLFVDDNQLLTDLRDILGRYEGRNRVGDHYVRNLFYCTVMCYYDKFGDSELKQAAELCFLWAYRLRLEQSRVSLPSIDNLAREENSMFRRINQAQHPHQFLSVSIKAPKTAAASKVGDLKTKFNQLLGCTL